MDTDQKTQADTKSPTSVKEEAKDLGGDIAKDAKGAVRDAQNFVASQVDDVKHNVQDQADKSLKRGRDAVVSQVGGVASALRSAGEQLRGEDQNELADYSERLGDQIQGVADYFDNRDIRDMARDVEAFARKQPAVFVSASLAVGLVAARFLKSSRRS